MYILQSVIITLYFTLDAQLFYVYPPTTVVYCSCDGMLPEDLCLHLAIGKILLAQQTLMYNLKLFFC